MKNLYKADLSEATWVKPCGGNDDENGDEETCVLVADTSEMVAIRDSKNPAAEALRFTRPEMDAFVRHYVQENGIVT